MSGSYARNRQCLESNTRDEHPPWGKSREIKPLGPRTGAEGKVAELEGYFWFPLRGGTVTGGDQLLLGSFTCVHLATCLYPCQTVFFPRAQDRELVARMALKGSTTTMAAHISAYGFLSLHSLSPTNHCTETERWKCAQETGPRLIPRDSAPGYGNGLAGEATSCVSTRTGPQTPPGPTHKLDGSGNSAVVPEGRQGPLGSA